MLYENRIAEIPRESYENIACERCPSYSLLHCDRPDPLIFDLYPSLTLSVQQPLSHFELFRELNKLDFNFCGNSLVQFCTELFAKKDSDLLTLGQSHSIQLTGLWIMSNHSIKFHKDLIASFE